MKRLLIVDDEAYARQAVANTISWSEHEIRTAQASTGKEALEYMELNQVDVLMTDIRMPAMSGLELIEEILKRGWNPGIIVLSSYNEFELVRSAMQLGAQDYLFKPTMMPKDILEAVLRVLEKRKGSEEQERKPEKIVKEYIRNLLRGEQVPRIEQGQERQELELWEKRQVFVIAVRLLKYQEGLSGVFTEDIQLLQFAIGNVLQEAVGMELKHEIFLTNYKEYILVAGKPEMDTVLETKTRVSRCLNSAFTFLRLYYGIEAAAGVSTFQKGLVHLSRQYAYALDTCLRLDGGSEKVVFFRDSQFSGGMKREVYQALNFIEDHLGKKDLSLQMVADYIGVSKNYFSKIFKEAMKVTFVDYVTRQRMEQARNLYLNSDLKIYEIAELVGYSDWHYLYNLYKKTYGHSLSKEKDIHRP